MDEIKSVLTSEQIEKIYSDCRLMLHDLRLQPKDRLIAFARAIERAVREATTQAQIDAANELERIAQAIGDAGINGFGNAVRSVAERLASQPVSATQEQAMDARNQTPSDAIRSEAPDALLAIQGKSFEDWWYSEGRMIDASDKGIARKSWEASIRNILPSPEAIDAEKL